ncbi:hypothetical protein CC2G_003056 [Coprinopsis cinerea AmutBmut pab1-1]|nr:hypothetical protein CC2G_003056 [Coprinopsis cinerea AmutBmut pab1-1]
MSFTNVNVSTFQRSTATSIRIKKIGDGDPRSGLEQIPASRFRFTFKELRSAGYHFEFEDTAKPDLVRKDLGTSPHPTRAIANGRPAFVLRIFPWCDDVSGNRSKQYNPHINLYTKNANLPHLHHNQEYFVRFVTTSQHASALEQFDALKSDFGVWTNAYDCELAQEIVFQVQPHCLPADNPQQAESCSCGGLGSNHNCRYDTTGGTKSAKESNEGYHSLFQPGTPRTPENTRNEIERQIKTACSGVDPRDLQTETGVKDKIAQFWISQVLPMAKERFKQRATDPATKDERLKAAKLTPEQRTALKDEIREEIQTEMFSWLVTQPPERYELLPKDSELRGQLRPGDHFNPFLSVDGLDPHRDSPCETLHTYLLGQKKYVWHATSKGWDKKKEDVFATRLRGVSIDGLSIDSIRAQYFVRYKNSLIGKHFKSLQQVAIFCLNSDSLCSPDLFNLWKASGELGALLWFSEIRNMDEYVENLSVAIANVLDLWAVLDPERIITKFKLHALTHLPDDVRRFGPPALFATEVFECWNAIFRFCSILSNHQSPSHDIANTLIGMERFKHQVSGGWWKDSKGQWVQAGPSVKGILARDPELQRRLGWSEGIGLVPGTVRVQAARKRVALSFSEILSPWNQLVEPEGGPGPRRWWRGVFLVSRSGDICKEDSWVFYYAHSTETVQAGRIRRIIAPEGSDYCGENRKALVLIERYSIASNRDARFGMPILVKPNDISESTRLLPTSDILFIFNAQHDCAHAQCETTRVPILQEREETTQFYEKISHRGDEQFLINTHALHNAVLLREAIPRSLTQPLLVFQDRKAKHDEFAATLQITGPAKRADTAAKRKETTARKSAAKALREQAKKTVADKRSPVVDEPLEERSGPGDEGPEGEGMDVDKE